MQDAVLRIGVVHAVPGMSGEQELHYHPAGRYYLGRLGVYHHALRYGSVAGAHQCL